MTTSDDHDVEIDIHDLLEQRRQIAVIWSAGDVQEIRPDLTDDEAWQVLRECAQRHDCNEGLNWTSIEIVADDLFGSSTEHVEGAGA